MTITKKQDIRTPVMNKTPLNKERPKKQIMIPPTKNKANIAHLLVLNHFQMAFSWPYLHPELL